MLDLLSQLMASDSLSPHGICLLWRPELIWIHAISDTVIGLAYYSIPLALAYFAMKRPDIGFSWVIWCFVAFILACGTTHFLSIWTLWVPDYGIEGLVKAATAIVSVMTAILLWPLLPKVIALPSPAQLRAVNLSLQEGIAQRDAALEALGSEQRQRAKVEAMLAHSQKLEAIGQLTGGVAHDFNNLLTAVLMNLRRLERNVVGDDQRRAVGNAISAAERGAKLTQQMLAFARKQPLAPEVHALDSVVLDLLPILKDVIGVAADIRLDMPETPTTALVDRSQFETALINLVANARDAAQGDCSITISIASAGEEVKVAVADKGAGMSPDVLSRAIEPFFTTKPVGAGSGLGLSQVHGFVEQSGGRLAIESESGKGTSITLHLPAAAVAAMPV